MKANRNKSEGDRVKKSTSSAQMVQIENMMAFLQYLTPNRLAILQKLRECGPMQLDILSFILRRTEESVYTDVMAFQKDGIIAQDKWHRYTIQWNKMRITVQQEYPYLPNSNVRNLADVYLFNCTRQFSWLEVRSKGKFSETAKFSCTVEFKNGR